MNQSRGKPVADSAIAGQIYKVFPNDINTYGTVFGGLVMAECDRIALVVAERHSGRVCVTASVDSMHFLAPARKGETLMFKAAVNRTWRSSMEIGVRVEAENSYTGERRHVVSSYSTFVALDENDRPVAVPPLLPQTEAEKRRYEAADIRRRQRLAMRDAVAG